MATSFAISRIAFPSQQRSQLSFALGLALYGALVLPSTVAAQTVIGEGESVTVPGSYASPWNIPAAPPGEPALVIHGVLAIRDGGVVNASSTILGGAGYGRPVAAAVVSGAGSVWNTGDLDVAADWEKAPGDARLTIENGARVDSGVVVLASSFTSTRVVATADLRGTGSVWNARGLGVGTLRGDATLNVSQGAILNTAELSHVGGYVHDHHTGTYASTSSVTLDGAGSRWNALGDVVIDRQSQVTVANGAVLSTPVVRLTPGSDVFNTPPQIGGVLNVGGAMDGNLKPLAATTAGYLDVTFIEFAGRSGTLNFNHTSTNFDFNAYLVETPFNGNYPPASSAQINVYSGTTVLHRDSSAFGGTTTISGGRFLIAGSLGGRILVNGGVLGGPGEVGSVEVGAGGTLAPDLTGRAYGGPIEYTPNWALGRMTVSGDLTFNPGSVFQVDVTPEGYSDRVAVSGRVVINGGSVVALESSPEFLPFTQYTILTADGGVSGAFAEATNNYAFLDTSLSYEPNAVKLQLVRNDVSFASIGVTPNQQAVAAGAESTGPGRPLWNAVAMLDQASARAVFDLMSGEVYAGSQAALIEDGLLTQQVVLGAFDAHDERNGAWVKVIGSQAETDADGNAAMLKRDTSGVLIGGDFALGDIWHLGGLIGSGQTSNDIDARNASSQSDSVSAGVYADAQWDAGWGVRLGGIRTRHDIDSRRQLDVSGLGTQFTSSTQARATQFFGELGYAFEAGRFELEPFLGLSQMRLDVDGFTETGGVGALQSNESESTTRYSTAGVRLKRESAAGRWTVGGSLAWRHASGDLDPVSVMRFDGGQPFVVQAAPLSQSAAIVEANVATKLGDRISLGASYLGQTASEAEEHGATVWLSARF